MVIVEGNDDNHSVDAATISASACEDEDHFDQTYEEELDEEDDDVHIMNMLLRRPIVVGYSFGPKKMSTMGVVMAEASRTGLSTQSVIVPSIESLKEQRRNQLRNVVNDHKQEEGDGQIDSTSISPEQRSTILTTNLALTQEVLSSFTDEQRKELLLENGTGEKLDGEGMCDEKSQDNASSSKKSTPLESNQASSVVFHSGEHRYSSTMAASTAVHHPQSHHPHSIVRHLRSSSPSVSSWGSTGTRTASTAASVRTLSAHGGAPSGGHRTTTTADSSSLTRTSTAGSAAARSKTRNHKKSYPIRVSFVPLDPEIPLEEQHGGIDVILHKLTEDILLLSQLSLTNPKLKTSLQLDDPTLDTVLHEANLEECDVAAVRRVHRLCQFQKLHGCSLVDDPVCVQTLMSRADIASVLKDCLDGVTSLSGMPVRSPNYAVVARSSGNKDDQDDAQEASAMKGMLYNAVYEADLSFPLIAKPLTAAGTKASHSMAVITHPSGLEHVVDRAPCLFQEYANHNAVLYKVYVLGDFVSVYKRRSLPNLPSQISKQPVEDASVVVEFDSQRPYPRLRDFGFHHPEEHPNFSSPSPMSPTEPKNGGVKVQPPVTHETCTPLQTDLSSIKKTVEVTPDEVRPIVEALKQAFGLEIFGFDVLIEANKTTASTAGTSMNHHEDKPCMLVVDVNYFPSYKEVPDFPALLAKFLTGRAIQSRLEQIRASTSKAL